ncbi:hypothetical protein TSOC_002814 [Tetrabaena socialis]|uniref:N-acetyltransferase domain-containing protein n=1 Tax=Tetrabaena socialis TaxID=47790 RepID=A0A2J8AD53_9CHLO|nr:hypothetical protein TSOC_002814 [Tetrabaena socialis]|eukprot:PNH10450.1 hypothetical protein TSOC_002814 [Tetrabaena socialis]
MKKSELPAAVVALQYCRWLSSWLASRWLYSEAIASNLLAIRASCGVVQQVVQQAAEGTADPRQRRAYLSNVCVAPAARRLGVARSLLQHAEQVARREGVEWLYVHVVADNRPALTLYCDAMGYQVEQSESEGTAHTLQRPRRLLLAKQLA